METTNYYAPGVCNINEPEVAYRKKAGHISVGIGVVMFAALVLVNTSPILGVAMFLPVFLAAISYLQAKNKFCVTYGASGVYNSSDEYAQTAKIVEEASHKLDKARARKMNTQAAIIGLVGAVLSVAVLVAV